MRLQTTTYNGWNILFNGDSTLLELIGLVIERKLDLRFFNEIKNNRRSLVYRVEFKGITAILKNPREKNRKKWIRFTTLYRQGEAFRALSNLASLATSGIASNKPLLAAEKRRFGMVVDSWILCTYENGRACRQTDYPAVVRTLKEIHAKNRLHGDPQIDNFLIQGNTVITIDSNPKTPVLASIARYREFFHLARSAPGIENHFRLDTGTAAYLAAAAWSNIYWKWRDHKKRRRIRKKNLKRILVIRFSSIGDIILTTPVLAALKKRYPQASIDFLVIDAFKDAISGNPNIDDLILFNKDAYQGICGIYRYSRKLKTTGYDLVIDLHSKIRSRLLTLFTGARTLRYRKRSLWKSLLVRLRMIRYHVDDTIVRSYFKPLEKLHVYYTGETLSFDFNEGDLEKVAHYGNAVVMAPGAANMTKQWLPEYFSSLGRQLRDQIILVGGSKDYDMCEDIRADIGESCTNLAGKLSLKQSGALMSLSKFIITNDSGPLHMARGLGKKVFVIFGPTDPHMFTYDENAILIYAAVPCSPCSLHGDKQCPEGHFECMNSLTPEDVYQKIRE